MSASINDLLKYAIEAKASDLHLSTGSIPMVRIDGVMQTLQLPVMTKDEMVKISNEILNDNQSKILSDNLEIDYTISYDHNLIKEQRFNYEFKDSNQFKNLISNCRTFGFKEEVDSLRKKGLIAGGSLDNAIVLDKKGIVNNDKLRQENEFVKHKILDFIGDIYLLGYSVKGAFEIYKGGHRLTHETMNSIMSDHSNWRLINEDNLNDKNYQKTYYTKSVAASL